MKSITLLLVAIICSCTIAQDQSPYGNNAKAGHYVQAGDAKIYYELYGKGKPLVLLHGGIMGSIGEMKDFIVRFSKNYQVAIATRGHGKSEIGNSVVTYEQKANDIMAVINAVTQDSVIMLGFSDGAYIGYKVASMYPAKVKKLIAIGAGEQVPGLRKVVFDPKMFTADNPFWKSRMAIMPEPERFPEFLKKMETFYNTMMASKELFASIKCPVLVLSGERDMNAPLATVIAAYQMIPNSQLGIIPKAGHVVFMENFPAVWECVVPFIER